MVSRMSGGSGILLHVDRSHPETLAAQVRLASAMPSARPDDRGDSAACQPRAGRDLACRAASWSTLTRNWSPRLSGDAAWIGTIVSDAVRISSAHSSWLARRREPATRLWRPGLDLRPAGPDLALLSRSQGARTMAELFRHLPAAEFGYTGPWGVARLRRQLEPISAGAAAMAPADGIVVVSGGTQA